MLSIRKFVLLVAVTCHFAPEVRAEDYPFSGAYAMTASNGETARWRKVACLTHFLTQTRTGHYALFHLDPVALMSHDRLQYVAYETGRCWHDQKHGIDACKVEYNYRNEIDPYFVRYENDNFTDTRLVVGDDWDTLAQPDPNRFETKSLIQVKCPFSLSKIKPYLSTKRTRYRKADVEILIGLFGLTPLLEFHRRVRAKLSELK